MRSKGTPILNLNKPQDVKNDSQRELLDFAGKMNQIHSKDRPAEASLEARIQSFELAYRMQSAAPSALDLKSESENTKKLYGIEKGNPGEYFGTQCLMARRLVERGVRFVQLYSGGGHGDNNWDAHGSITGNHNKHCAATDQPIAGLIRDLEQRGMLDETLIVWEENLEEHLISREVREEIIIRSDLPCGWQVEASKVGQAMVKLTKLDTMQQLIGHQYMTFMQPFYT